MQIICHQILLVDPVIRIMPRYPVIIFGRKMLYESNASEAITKRSPGVRREPDGYAGGNRCDLLGGCKTVVIEAKGYTC
ncbi:hypothetical protein Y032_0118g740 [Ancylostoma ceylanicum]|uniref:Uncharacterized protein n=1 Tax=Ancylostoma ceylanicum TaxID=53326 RepID=A0A016TBN2_9BILA|nr:hypothetical protein Y032_0118g740 [Ancylostoma ceylanicum]